MKGCHLCQLVCNEKPPPRQYQARINPNYVPMSRLSMDLKVMPRSHKSHKHILCIIDEVTNYLITVPIFQVRSEEIGEALIENVITKYCIPEYMIMDQDSTFISSLMTYLLNKFHFVSCQHGSHKFLPLIFNLIIQLLYTFSAIIHWIFTVFYTGFIYA